MRILSSLIPITSCLIFLFLVNKIYFCIFFIAVCLKFETFVIIYQHHHPILYENVQPLNKEEKWNHAQFFNFILIPCVVLMNRSQNYTKRDPKLNTKTCKCVSLCLILPSIEKKERQLRAKKNNENLFSCFAMCLHSILSEWNRENASAINCEQRQKSK